MAFIELKHVSKMFPGVLAMDDVSLSLKKGEVHGLIGENGAGKSTLIKVLTGLYKPEKGSLYIDGKETQFVSVNDAIKKGIGCIYQELNIVKELSIMDNIFLGRELKKKSGFLDFASMEKKSRELLLSLGQDLDPKIPIEQIGVGHQQMVEIARSLSMNIEYLIMDEPSSSLSENEIRELKKIVFTLKEKGVGVLFVSHKLEEIFEICDVVTVMRDGQHITTESTTTMTKDKLISLMVGRDLSQQFPKQETNPGETVLEVKDLCRYGVFKNINFSLKKGEILGFSGLVGAGRTELFRAIFGADQIDEGKIFLDGKEVKINNPTEAVEKGFAFITEDRKEQGLVLDFSVKNNLCLASYKKLKKKIFVNDNKIDSIVENNIKQLKIKTPNANSIAGQLSGGNQQKVVIGKWINSNANIYIFDEPTRGIDVGAKVEVYNFMNELLSQGAAIIMISSELPEILGMSDRVIVMREGEIMAGIDRDSSEFNQNSIMKAAWGGTQND